MLLELNKYELYKTVYYQYISIVTSTKFETLKFTNKNKTDFI